MESFNTYKHVSEQNLERLTLSVWLAAHLLFFEAFAAGDPVEK